jgi:vang-like
MEPDTYGGLLNSAPIPPTLILPIQTGPPPSTSSSRRQHHKKRHEQVLSAPVVTSTDSQDERIEVKIFPQDDNWGETTTITCNGGNEDALTNNNDTTLQLNDHIHPNDHFQHSSSKIQRRTRSIMICHFAFYLLCLIAFISPVLFLTLPYALITSDLISIDDYTYILTIIFKLLLLFIGTLLLLYRRRNTTYLPRIHLYKMYFFILLTMIILAYWLYYVFKLLLPKVEKYEKILSMTSTYEDLLLFLLLLVVLVLEVKWLYPKWIVKVVRSPDGQTRQYTIGKNYNFDFLCFI